MGRILRRLIAAVLLTLLLVGFAGSSALAAPCDDYEDYHYEDYHYGDYHYGDYPVILDHPVLNNPVFDYPFGNYPVILDHPVLNNPVFNNYTYNNPRYIYKDNTYNNRYNNRYNNPY